jgi:rhodanese-related sulfurtransferase
MRAAIALVVGLAICGAGLLAQDTASTRSDEAIKHTKDSLDIVKKLVAEKKAVILDVRELGEWKEGHVAGARSLPISKLRRALENEEDVVKIKEQLPAKQESKESEQAEKEKTERIVYYCHCMAGRRALAAAEILQKLGYEARALKPGYDELLEAGFDQAKEEESDKPTE